MGEYKRPEILAPAGSVESMKAAVAAGCDAVYIGGSRFGARAYADNPRGEQMVQAIRYCHRYGVKVYLTVNTLLKDLEIQQELYDFLLPFYREGIDAVIVQDVGVMRFIHRNFPDMPLHASTQMTLTAGRGDCLLKPFGVTRLVTARELTLSELEQMRCDTSLEMEVFVHGALCYCYSGQCLFSSMLGGRSGNRGRCAQPCRQPYCLEGEEEEAYLLSPREHCSLGHVGELIEAGIDSLKIEGRMKRPEYVALATAMYRKYVDLYIKLGKEGYQAWQKENWREWQEDLRRLAEIYNREGFTAGYLEGLSGVPYAVRQGKGEMLAARRPNHGGVFVGRVTAVDRGTVTYHLEKDLHAQDVVEFRDQSLRQTYEYTLGREQKAGESVTTRYLKDSHIRVGDAVYRTKDAELLKMIREQYLKQDAVIPVRMEFVAHRGEAMVVTVSSYRRDGSLEQIRMCGDECQTARSQAAREEEIRRLLCQTGGTSFVVEECGIELGEGIFLPVGAVKRLRRQVLDRLQERLETALCRDLGMSAERRREELELPAAGQQEEPELPVYSVSVLYEWQARLAISSEHIHAVYLRTEEMGESVLRQLILEGYRCGRKMYVMMPAVFREAVWRAERERLSRGTDLYHMPELAGFVIRNLESLVFLTQEAGIAPQRIITDANLYIFNREAVRYWQEQGVAGNTLPLELTGKELGGLLPLPGAEAVLYGYIPLMVSAQCVRHNRESCGKGKQEGGCLTIRDGRNRTFSVFNACKYCYNIIYHGEPLSLAEEEQFLYQQGVRRFRYDLTWETPQQAAQIVEGKLPDGQKGHFYTPIS